MALNEIQKKERSEYLEHNLSITECFQNKKYVFISYASDNWESVFKTAVVPLQREYGMRVYADKAFDKENDKWIIPMLRNIRGAQAVIAFVSQSYIESYACFLELLTAVNNNIPIVFVSLENDLRLGNTTDQPEVERGVKNEIIRQGDNLATKTNNTSNDIMRAMKSAYTSLSTLLEQDALSKYDISDAFISFFRDASVNKKTINDLKALKRSINSVSKDVFDADAVKPAPTVRLAPNAVNESAPSYPGTPAATAPAAAPTPAVRHLPGAAETAPSYPSAPASASPVKAPDPQKRKMIIIGAAAALAVIITAVIIILVSSVKTSAVTDMAYNLAVGGDAIYTVTYTGEWKSGKPNGQGSCTFGANANDYAKYTGLWENGTPANGKMTKTDGSVYEGGFSNGKASGQGTQIAYDENGNITSIYEGGFQDGKLSGQGMYTQYNENVKVKSIHNGEYKDDKANGQGTQTAYDENGKIRYTYTGEYKDGNWNGQGKKTNYGENGNISSIYEGQYQNGKPEGQGTWIVYDENGNAVTTQTGMWSDGKFVD